MTEEIDLLDLIDETIADDEKDSQSFDRQLSGVHEITPDQTTPSTPEITEHDHSKLD